MTMSWRRAKPPFYVTAWYKRNPLLRPAGHFGQAAKLEPAGLEDRQDAFAGVNDSAQYHDTPKSRRTMGEWAVATIRRLMPTAAQKAAGDLWRVIRRGNCNDFSPAYLEELYALGVPRSAMRFVICKIRGEAFLHMALRVERVDGWIEWYDNRFQGVMLLDGKDGLMTAPPNYEVRGIEGDYAEHWCYPVKPRTLASLLPRRRAES